MQLREKVSAVQNLFEDLDQEIAKFQAESTIYCKAGCGKCCFKPDIEATVLEFLPFALEQYRLGKSEEWLLKTGQTDSTICKILNPQQSGAGLCSQYARRGLICRLFGYSARTNKYGKNELITCQIIKTEQSDSYQLAEEKIEAGGTVPVMSQYYMRLHSIDPDLATDFYPINEAIKRAMETVLHYYAYREEEGI